MYICIYYLSVTPAFGLSRMEGRPQLPRLYTLFPIVVYIFSLYSLVFYSLETILNFLPCHWFVRISREAVALRIFVTYIYIYIYIYIYRWESRI